jgi:hypothetical protein
MAHVIAPPTKTDVRILQLPSLVITHNQPNEMRVNDTSVIDAHWLDDEITNLPCAVLESSRSAYVARPRTDRRSFTTNPWCSSASGLTKENANEHNRVVGDLYITSPIFNLDQRVG